MIYGVGVDTASVARIEKSLCRAAFLQRVYGAQERALLQQRGGSAEVAAANFAAKEAFGKALGTGICTAFALDEVQALRDAQTKAPYFCLSGRALALLREKRLRAHLSLTHEGGFATAFVILETDGAQPPQEEDSI